jgi:hypothetical protein
MAFAKNIEGQDTFVFIGNNIILYVIPLLQTRENRSAHTILTFVTLLYKFKLSGCQNDYNKKLLNQTLMVEA